MSTAWIISVLFISAGFAVQFEAESSDFDELTEGFDDSELTANQRAVDTQPIPESEETTEGGELYYTGKEGERSLNEFLDMEARHRADRDISQRGRSKKSKLLNTWTLYKENGAKFKESIRSMCQSAHNYLRKKHKRMPVMVYDEGIAKSAAKWAKTLADRGLFDHDPRIKGKLGENLYRNDNNYNMKANPVHAVAAWYAESWAPLPLGSPPRNYDYGFNPKTSSEFKKAGVGHFTQLMWDDSVHFGCGAAVTTYKKGTVTWTRVVIATRYVKPGNLLGYFPRHIKPPKGGPGSLNGMMRSPLYPGRGCVSTVNLKQCKQWVLYRWCHNTWAQRDCECMCRK